MWADVFFLSGVTLEAAGNIALYFPLMSITNVCGQFDTSRLFSDSSGFSVLTLDLSLNHVPQQEV